VDGDLAQSDDTVDIVLVLAPFRLAFDFKLENGVRIPLQDIFVGAFAVVESSERHKTVRALGLKNTLAAKVLVDILSRQAWSVSWKEMCGKIYCLRMVPSFVSHVFKWTNILTKVGRSRGR
jgi:hypothetical protein